MDDVTKFTPNLARYETLMDVVRNRLTSRAFRPDIAVPREHMEMVLEAARHAPSGANAQPWHYIVVTDPAVKKQIADYFVAEATKRAKLKMKFPTPNYRGLETAPGFVVVAADFRFVRAFPVLLDGSDLDKTLSGQCRAYSAAKRGRLHHVSAFGRRSTWLSGLVGDRNWPGGCAEIAASAARRAGRSRDHRHHGLRRVGKARLQALEENAAADYELGAFRHAELHERGRNRCVGARDAPQGHVS